EAAPAFGGEVIVHLALLLVGRKSTPVFHLQVYYALPMHDLVGFLDVFPQKGRPQYRMPGDCLFPGTGKSPHVEFAPNRVDILLEAHAGPWPLHALLHRRQWVDVFRRIEMHAIGYLLVLAR